MVEVDLHWDERKVYRYLHDMCRATRWMEGWGTTGMVILTVCGTLGGAY